MDAETSDSEYFESADEDFASDVESETTSVKPTAGHNLTSIEPVEKKLEDKPKEKFVASSVNNENIINNIKEEQKIITSSVQCKNLKMLDKQINDEFTNKTSPVAESMNELVSKKKQPSENLEEDLKVTSKKQPSAICKKAETGAPNEILKQVDDTKNCTTLQVNLSSQVREFDSKSNTLEAKAIRNLEQLTKSCTITNKRRTSPEKQISTDSEKENRNLRKDIPEKKHVIANDDDLWNSEDGWGGSTELDTINQSNITKTNKVTTLKNSTDDLWNSEDGWGCSTEENLWSNEELDWGKESEISELETSSNKTSIGTKTVSSNKTSFDNKTGFGDKAGDKNVIKKADDSEDDDFWNDNDKWETESQKLAVGAATGNSWGGWNNWGVTSLLTTATQGVSTITSQVSQILETGIGVPNPEEMARLHNEEKKKLINVADDRLNITHDKVISEDQQHSRGFGIGNLVKLVESTGTKVITGGLGTLETIGKKTMEVLQEGDPLLIKKRALLNMDQNKPILSQLLREAKEKAEAENKTLEEKHLKKRAKNYETLFDDHQGLVHLEALELLSKQCDIKLETIMSTKCGDDLIDMKETMDQVKELCELPDEDDEEHVTFEDIKDKLKSVLDDLNVPVSYDRLVETWQETDAWLNKLSLNICSESELHQQAVDCLAQLTAIAVEQYHKMGELLLIKDHRSTVDEADGLVQLTTSLTSLIGMAAAKFSDTLNNKAANQGNKENINELITNIFYEAANSSSYIQDAFQLLIPVLQVGAV